MSVLGTVRDLLVATSRNPNRDGTAAVSDGAYWCDDCSVRIRDVEVSGEAPPDCPDCGDEMRFERSAAAPGCAC